MPAPEISEEPEEYSANDAEESLALVARDENTDPPEGYSDDHWDGLPPWMVVVEDGNTG